MRNITLILGLFICITAQMTAQEKIHWMSMNEALAAQKKEPKKIIMDAYTVWCGPCKMMAKKTFQNPDLVTYVNNHFYAVKFNAEGRGKINYKGFTYTNPKYDPARKNGRNYQHLFAKYLKIRAYPTVVFFDENGDYIAPVMGYRDARELEVYLKMVATGDYKKVTTQEAWKTYKKGFEHSFEM